MEGFLSAMHEIMRNIYPHTYLLHLVSYLYNYGMRLSSRKFLIPGKAVKLAICLIWSICLTTRVCLMLKQSRFQTPGGAGLSAQLTLVRGVVIYLTRWWCPPVATHGTGNIWEGLLRKGYQKILQTVVCNCRVYFKTTIPVKVALGVVRAPLTFNGAAGNIQDNLTTLDHMNILFHNWGHPFIEMAIWQKWCHVKNTKYL